MWLVAYWWGRRPLKCQMWLLGLRLWCLHGIIEVHGIVLVQSRWGRLHVARRVIPDSKQKRFPLLNWWLKERGSVTAGNPGPCPGGMCVYSIPIVDG